MSGTGGGPLMVSALAAPALVALGGAVGSALRYAVVAAARPHSPDFPLGTLAVNLAGCAAIGVVGGWLAGLPPESRGRLLLMAGVLGGFTTFSSVALEVGDLLRGGRLGAAAAYLVLTNALGVALALAGYMLTARPA